MDVLVPVVFPDYLISTPAGRLPYLGHAGVLIINGSTSQTRYYEYGRYDAAERGLVRRRRIPNVVIDTVTGKPTRRSLEAVLNSISQQAGQRGRITGSYIEAAGGYNLALRYAESKLSQNEDANRRDYSLVRNSCVHFMRDTTAAAGINMPWLVDPRPTSYIAEIRSSGTVLDYDPNTGLSLAN